ncbi:MAG TPA: discoidin domain-containing protein [Armatimonadota bacterium]|nr:discoidin domain-containing protein [Armatimonadota bacterium]
MWDCPTTSKKGAATNPDYVYNNVLDGTALGDVSDPTATFCTADGQHLATAATRHSKKTIAAFVDGHVETTDKSASWTYKGPDVPAGAQRMVVKPVGVDEAASKPYSALYPASHTLDATGLSADIVTGAEVPAIWPGHTYGYDQIHYPWCSSTKTDVHLIYDLGQAYYVSAFHLWNTNAANSAKYAVRTANVAVSLNGTSFTPVTITPNVLAVPLPTAPATFVTNYRGEDYQFGSPAQARYVRITPLTCYDDTQQYFEIQKIRFIVLVLR